MLTPVVSTSLNVSVSEVYSLHNIILAGYQYTHTWTRRDISVQFLHPVSHSALVLACSQQQGQTNNETGLQLRGCQRQNSHDSLPHGDINMGLILPGWQGLFLEVFTHPEYTLHSKQVFVKKKPSHIHGNHKHTCKKKFHLLTDTQNNKLPHKTHKSR